MELEVAEGRVFGARYYTVKPEFGWAEGWLNQHWNDMTTWCVETYGPTAEDGVFTPGARWYVNNSKFWFRGQEDLLLFVLKWK